MVVLRDLKAIILLGLLIVGCSDGTNSAGEMSKQVVEKTNVSPLLAEAYETQKVEDYFKQGNNFLESQRYTEAIAEYEKALKIKPDKYEAWINQGNALTALQRYQDAIATYDKAIAIKKDLHEAWYNRGNALTALHLYVDAVVAYKKAIAIKPDKYEAWINQGIALTKLTRYTEAIAAYDKAIAIYPKKHEAYYNKACSYALQNNIELTIKNLHFAIKLSGNRYQQLAKTDPDFDKVRADKRFQELLQ